MVTYRIYTQKKKVKVVTQIVSEHFGGFTVYFGTGYWEGVKERCMVIEIMTEPKGEPQALMESGTVRLICRKIKGLNRQDAVMWTRSDMAEMEVV